MTIEVLLRNKPEMPRTQPHSKEEKILLRGNTKSKDKISSICYDRFYVHKKTVELFSLIRDLFRFTDTGEQIMPIAVFYTKCIKIQRYLMWRNAYTLTINLPCL